MHITHRSEFKLAKGAKAGLLGYRNNEKAAYSGFLGQPSGVWSVCLGNDGDLQGKEEDSDFVKLPKMDQLYKGNKMQDVGLPMACQGETKYRTWYKDAVFCNGGYKYATAASHYAIDATRGHRTMPGVVSFSMLRPFGPSRATTMLRA